MSLLFVCLFIPAISYGQGKITRHTHQSQTNDHKTSQKVTISEPDGFINGHGYVDLGLPSGTKWATCNVGASNPEEIGEYFSWGASSSVQDYSKDNCQTFQKPINDFSGNPKYDAASSQWGNNWKTPTVKLWEELDEYSTFETCKEGFKIIGPNGKSIFLPFSGFKVGDSVGMPDWGCYWSSTPYISNSMDVYGECGYGQYYVFFENYHRLADDSRFCGKQIRAIYSN